MTAPAYRLVRAPAPPPVRLDDDAAQRAVLEHPGGPLLVLAGPGTGKTTTLVEAVARRVEGGLSPDQVLVLTFSRKAADELRERITVRLGRTVATPAAWTFHSWCYAFLRQHQEAERFVEPLRLLSGPEQDVALRDLLRGSLELGRQWPPELRACIGTRGFAEEVRALLARARSVGLDPEALATIAAREGRADWSMLSAFFGEYLDVLDAQGAIDYAELIAQAVALAERPAVRDGLRERYRAVFVDEYQDTDPAQERLLQALAGDGRDLTVVGDPDQAIYAFRGAEVSGLLEFRDRFRTTDGSPAPVLALRTCRRSGAALLAASRRLAAGITAPGLPGQTLRLHRELRPAAGIGAGSVEVVTFPSVGAEGEAIADLLRRQHLEEGRPWGSMAVLVRSGVRSIPLLRRVLSTSGVPVVVAGDELPLSREPAVAPLLLGLRCAADADELTAERVRTLLLSPLVGADPAALRRLGRELRALDRAGAAADGEPHRLPRPSAELLREAVADPRDLLLIDDRVAAPARRLADLLACAAKALQHGDGPEAALWELWSGSHWPRRLEAAAMTSGAAGRAANRDLDAVVSLFSTIARAAEQRRQVAAVGPLLDEIEAQQIPADTLAERSVPTDAVRLLTAHRSKGLEWDLVVVAGVQEDGWPDLRRRHSLLQSERLDRDGVREPETAAGLLVDERRLFYVAVTRARQRVVVTAVDSPEEDGERPSRFLGELGVEIQAVRERVGRPLSLPALVAQLRRITVDPQSSEPLRAAAATRLAQLAATRADDGAALVPAADPGTWWGIVDVTTGDQPVRADGEPVRLSGTSLSSLTTCPLRWFLEHEAHAVSATSTAMGFGGVVHALAHEVATGVTPADVEALTARLDRVWDALAYDAPWQSAQQRTAATEALTRFVAWHSGRADRELVGTEVDFSVTIDTPHGPAILRGSMDRVELDAEGRVHIVDLKTGKSTPRNSELETHAQLGTYQVAAASGALDELLTDRPPVGGAELVQLRKDRAGLPVVQSQRAIAAAADPQWFDTLLGDAVRQVRAEEFPPVPNDRCGRCPFRRCCPAQPDGRQVVA